MRLENGLCTSSFIVESPMLPKAMVPMIDLGFWISYCHDLLWNRLPVIQTSGMVRSIEFRCKKWNLKLFRILDHTFDFFHLLTFFVCHIDSRIERNRRISELVAKKITISSVESRTSWHENSWSHIKKI